MIFDRAAVVLLLGVLGVQAVIMDVSSKNHKESPPALPDEKNEDVSVRDDVDILPARYDNLLSSLYKYASQSRQSSTEIILSEDFASEKLLKNEVSDDLNSVSIDYVLKTPKMRTKVIIFVVWFTLDQLTRSSDNLEKAIQSLIGNKLASKELQSDIRVIMMGMESAKFALEDLRRSLNTYAANVNETTQLGRKIHGLGLEDFLKYTVSVMRSIRGAWMEWKMVQRSNYS